MAQDPREAWRKLQQTISNAQQQGRRGFGGNPRGAIGVGVGIAILVGGGLVVNNALFNGMPIRAAPQMTTQLIHLQSMVVIEPSSIHG